MKSLQIGRIENSICEYGFHRGKHCVLLTTCVSEVKQKLTLQQIHKYVDECQPKMILLQGETELNEDDPCNPKSFTPQVMQAFLDGTKVPIHVTTKGSWEQSYQVDWITLRFDRHSYPMHENVRYGSEAVINVATPEDLEAWLYCADDKLTYIHSWIKAKKNYETDDYIRDYIMTETNLGLKWHERTDQI